MLAPLSWLKEYVAIDISAEELQEKLFSCGFEVEELTKLGKDVSGVYVGRITKIEKHPDADRLQVCEVDLGEKGKRQICTAATNVFVGALVPCALDGATVLHEGGIQKIKTGKLRGVVSEGMFCSGEELGINNDFYEGAEVNGILLLKEEDAKEGDDAKIAVGLEDDLFDIAVTANRPDCQCILGIAREIAAILKKPLKMPALDYKTHKTNVKIPVTVQEPALCPRYIGHYVENVTIGVSPQWMRRRLAKCGLRSVSDIVDITNYVLLEMGQPMHAFDRDFLRGGEIIVRRAKEGEKIVTLDEKEFTLHADNLLICDRDGGVALAGIMGGLNSEIKPTTQAVFFEAAKFARDNVRKTSRALGQRSDSSARFEKGIDAYTQEIAMNRALHLVEELGCGTVTDYRTDVNNADLTKKTITTSYEKINALLGIEVPEEATDEILTRLFFTVKKGKGGEFTAEVPLWREDIDGYPDLAEEVIRSYGYEHVTPTLLAKAKTTRGGYNASQKEELKFKRTLQRQGYSEAIGYSFYSPKDFDLLRLSAEAPERKAVTLLNPIGEDLSVMRTILLPTMIENVVRNVRRGNDCGRLFEYANVFLPKELPLTELPEERKHVCIALWGDGDFFDLKGAIEAIGDAFDCKFTFVKGETPYFHPGITAEVKLGEKSVGYMGELHPEIAKELALEKKAYFAELDYDAMKKKFAKSITFHGVPRFESIERDIAFVVAEKVTCAEAEACILHAVKAVKKAELFDVYRNPKIGAEKKSMAFRLTFSPEPDAEKPLTNEAVDGYFKKILTCLEKNLGAELR